MSWFSKKRNIVIAVGAVVLAIIAAVLIIYGVATHTEPVLLEACWVNDEARYVEGMEVDDGACEGSEELVWPKEQVPFTVAAISEETLLAPDSPGREGLDSAIRDINSQIGCKLLEPVEDGAGAAIVARVGEAVDVSDRRNSGRDGSKGSTLGWARHRRDGSGSDSRVYCDLVVYSTVGNLRNEYLVAHHELLHCLGLAHDPDNPASAIYPFTMDDTMWDRMHAARITDADRARLRELYCEDLEERR